MIDALIDLPSHLRERLASALESGLLQGYPAAAAVGSVLGIAEPAEKVSKALAELERLGVSGRAAGTWIRTIAKATKHAPLVDLVWSGPEVAGLHARDTRRVFEELLGLSKHSLWISTYVFFDGPRTFDVLARRMDEIAELQVTLLLNIQRKRGDTTAAEKLIRRFAERFWKFEWPGTARPRVFFDPRSLEIEVQSGVLHAKAVIADDDSVFITSANLTEAALERNIELGLLVRDRALASSITTHFRTLIDCRLLSALPRD